MCAFVQEKENYIAGSHKNKLLNQRIINGIGNKCNKK